ncbi:MAG: VanZ family protein [Deltaproteobacteria bacterium]|nr:VanZ family protein [Deltaproteobacteria bacterium]
MPENGKSTTRRKTRIPGWGLRLLQHRRSLVVVSTLAVFVMSSVPVSRPPRIPGLDKIVHITEYFLVGLSYLNLATSGFRRLPWKTGVTYLLLVVCLGSIDEFYQSFVPRRTSDWRDIIADTIGGLLALALGVYFTRRLSRLDEAVEYQARMDGLWEEAEREHEQIQEG